MCVGVWITILVEYLLYLKRKEIKNILILLTIDTND